MAQPVAQSAHKKVFVVRFERESLSGFVQTPGSFLPGTLELLSPAGSLINVPFSEIKAINFVRDFDAGDRWTPNRTFTARPKTPGLWIRLLFQDQDSAEGILTGDLLQIDPYGFYLIPPDPTFQNQRIFVPREALKEARVLGVIGSAPRRPRADKAGQLEQDQLEMFPTAGSRSGSPGSR